MKLIPTDLKLLAKLIEYNSEHSRWSTAFTLLISITIASLIAFLGSFIELQDSNLLFYNQEPEWITVNIQTDSMMFISSKQEKLPLKIVSLDSTNILMKKFLSDTLKYKNTKKNVKLPVTIATNKDSIFFRSENDSIPLKKNTFFLLLADSNSVSIKCVSNELRNILDTTSETGIKQIKLSYSSKKEVRNIKFSAFQILFLCTTFLGFIFTVFFFILRRNVEMNIIALNKNIEEQNQNPEFIFERLNQISEIISCLKDEDKDKLNESIKKLKEAINKEIEEQNQNPDFISEKLVLVAKDIFSFLKKQGENEIEKQKNNQNYDTKLEDIQKKLEERLNEISEIIKICNDNQQNR